MEDDLTLIDQYLNDEMSPQARLQFEGRLKAEDLLRQQYQIVKDMPVALDSDTDEFISVIRSISQETKKTTPVIKLKSTTGYKYLGIAASIILIAVAYFLLKPNVESIDVLYASNFEVYPSTHSIRGQDQNEGLYEQALSLYDNGQYHEAISFFNKYLETELSEDAMFYKAVSMMPLERSEEAIQIFNQLILAKSKHVDIAKWYTALGHLKLGNIEQSKEALQSIITATEDEFYKKRSSKLLSQLNNL